MTYLAGDVEFIVVRIGENRPKDKVVGNRF